MKKVIIYTDGACSGNPGKGGWGAVLIYDGHKKEISGYCADTTNNRMELQAVIESLSMLKEKCDVELYTDSTYVKNGITTWIKKWKSNGWKSADKHDVKNKDLWVTIDKLNQEHNILWQWVEGHANCEYNNLADRLATDEIKRNK